MQPPRDEEPVVSVPEVRDYQRINAETLRMLEAGHELVRLTGVDGQRLLLAGLRGPWTATIVVEGDAGPELAAGLDAPGVLVVCRGSAADGAGRSLNGGVLFIAGGAGAAVGYRQSGGTILVAGSAGPRAGLERSGGLLWVLGSAERLAGERQSAGVLRLEGTTAPFHLGFGRTGGRIVSAGSDDALTVDEIDESLSLLGRLTEWWTGDSLRS